MTVWEELKIWTNNAQRNKDIQQNMISVHKHKYCFSKPKGFTQITAGLEFSKFPLSLIKL